MQSGYVKWLRWGLIGGLFITLLIPFIVSNGQVFPNMFFPFITGKNFAFRILVELMLGLYVVLALREPRYRPRFSFILAAVLAFTVWAGVADLFSVDPVKSFWSNFERMEGYITILHLFAYFIIAASVLSIEKLWTNFFRASVAASVLMSFFGFLQLAGKLPIDQGGVRLDGTLGNATYLAVYMLFNVFFALLLLHRDWSNKMLRWFYVVVLILDTVVLLYTETRGTILGLVGGLLVAGLYLLWETRHDAQWKVLRRISLFGIGAIVVLAGIFFAVRNVPSVRGAPVLGRLASISLSDSTTYTRFIIWDMAWQGFTAKPITGWGQDNFNFVFNKYYNSALYRQEQWFDRAHDAFIDWLINAGLPGFLLFISLFGTGALAIWRSNVLAVPERAALLGLLAGFAFHELFVFDNIVSYLQFFIVLSLAHELSQRPVPGAVWLARPLSQNGIAVVAPIVAVLCLGGAWFLNSGGIANATGLLSAIEPPGSVAGASATLDGNLATFKALLAGAPLGRQEITEQLMQFAIAAIQSQTASPQIKQEFYTEAVSAITEIIKERPGDARLELFYGSFLDQTGQRSAALQQLELAQQESPDKQQIFFEIGMNNLLPQGDSKDAIAVLGQAFALDQSYDQARIFYVAALYIGGQISQADALLLQRYGTVTPDDTTLLQVYYQTKQYPRAEAILNARLLKNQNDTQGRLQLAATFYAAGDKVDAIAQLKIGAQKDPSFAPQANQMIQQIQAGK